MLNLAFVINDINFFFSHRLQIAIAAKEHGFNVIVVCPDSPRVKELFSHGFSHSSVNFSRSGQNVFSELKTLFKLFISLKTIKADIIHFVTIKPVIYGGFICHFIKAKSIVFAISGLGTVFVANSFASSLRMSLIKMMYKISLKHNNFKVIFQNSSDKEVISSICNLNDSNLVMIKGSGVNLSEYPFVAENLEQKAVVILACRLLRDKGVLEFASAAKLLHEKGVPVIFKLVGSLDPYNKSSLSPDELNGIIKDGFVKVLDYTTDVASLYANSNIVCLPSYREGLPKSLIEAAACGRAVITTDVPGCRDAIIPNKTGLLVPVRDSESLASAIEVLVYDSTARLKMGHSGRKFAECVFTIEEVVEKHLQLYLELGNTPTMK